MACIKALRLVRMAPLLGADYAAAIDGEYIVIFKSEVGDHDGELHTLTLITKQCMPLIM